jgi:anti-sigma factor RsiW
MRCPRAGLRDDATSAKRRTPCRHQRGELPSYNVPSETPQITCRRFVEFLSAWHDGELAQGARASFETHRAECARCARYAADFGAAIALLKSALTDSEGHTEFSEDLAQAILAACREAN